MPSEPVIYKLGHVKHNPETGAVAIRTIFPEDMGQNLADMAWLIATPDVGAKHSNTAGVESWDDLYTPPNT